MIFGCSYNQEGLDRHSKPTRATTWNHEISCPGVKPFSHHTVRRFSALGAVALSITGQFQLADQNYGTIDRIESDLEEPTNRVAPSINFNRDSFGHQLCALGTFVKEWRRSVYNTKGCRGRSRATTNDRRTQQSWLPFLYDFD